MRCSLHGRNIKLLNPDKTVLIPDMGAGCSLAESITGADVRALREAYPGVPIVTYVNTSAAVKAESDVCCTSSNAKKIVEAMGTDKVLCIPDEFLAQNIAQETDVEVLRGKAAAKCMSSSQPKNCANIAPMIRGLKLSRTRMRAQRFGRVRFFRFHIRHD